MDKSKDTEMNNAMDMKFHMDIGNAQDTEELSTFLRDLPPLEEVDGAGTSLATDTSTPDNGFDMAQIVTSSAVESTTPHDRLDITQVVCTFSVVLKLSLESLAKKLQNTRYSGHTNDPFDHLFYEIKDPRGIFIIHPSGKVRIFASKTTGLAKVAALGLAKTPRKMSDYKKARLENFKVEYIVAGKAREDFFPVKLDKLKASLNQDKELRKISWCFYEAESFHALKQEFTISGQKVVVNVFDSGAVRIVGATTLLQLYQAFGMVRPHVILAKVHSLAKPKPERVTWKDMTPRAKYKASDKKTVQSKKSPIRRKQNKVAVEEGIDEEEEVDI